MIYKIKDDYYIYRDRKYIKIKAELKGEEVSLVPDMNTFIEDNGDVNAKEITINDMKKELQKNEKSKIEEKEILKNKYKYSRDR